MTDTLRNISTRQHLQTEQADPSQARNAARGFTFIVDPLQHLRRFLATGVENGTYYTSAKDLAVESVASIEGLVAAGRGVEAVEVIVDMSERGATMRQQSTMFALAYLTGVKDEATRAAALTALPKVCRTASHLFLFASYVEQFRGWGRGLRSAVARWYTDQPVERLAYQGAKYRNRYGLTHRDLLRLSHPKSQAVIRSVGDVRQALIERVVEPERARNTDATLALLLDHARRTDWPAVRQTLDNLDRDAHALLDPEVEHLRIALQQDVQRSALFALLAEHDNVNPQTLPDTSLIAENLRLTPSVTDTVEVLRSVDSASWEMVQSDHLRDAEVWRALLDCGHVPLGAVIRNLGRLTANGTLDPLGVDDRTAKVIGRLRSSGHLKDARVHPMSVLLAACRYGMGRGDKGSLTWSPISNVNKALDAAFYAAFPSIEPDTERTVMLGGDVSGSMDNGVAGLPLTARTAMVATAQCLAAAFPRNIGVVFTGEGWTSWGNPGTNKIEPYDFDPGRRLTDVVEDTKRFDFGRTDCSLPMLHALDRGLAIDAFIVLTDNETYAGKMHPHEALRLYRERTGINARMVTVAFQHNTSTIADPHDPLMLDVVGLDSNVATLVGDFVAGRI